MLIGHSFVKTTGPGALNVDTMCQEGAFVIDNASFYPDTQLGLELTADADWQRRGLYIGPRVRVLDAVRSALIV
jgi:complement component 1 Q subcomponent-binding protein